MRLFPEARGQAKAASEAGWPESLPAELSQCRGPPSLAGRRCSRCGGVADWLVDWAGSASYHVRLAGWGLAGFWAFAWLSGFRLRLDLARFWFGWDLDLARF